MTKIGEVGDYRLFHMVDSYGSRIAVFHGESTDGYEYASYYSPWRIFGARTAEQAFSRVMKWVNARIAEATREVEVARDLAKQIGA